MWTADHTCGRREGVDESGEQPEGRPNRLAVTTGLKRPGAWPKRQKERRGEEERERDRPDKATQTSCTSYSTFPLQALSSDGAPAVMHQTEFAEKATVESPATADLLRSCLHC